MNDKLAYSASVLLSVLALLLLVANVSVINSNRSMQAQLAARQDIINKGMGLSKINEALVQSLADATVKSNDAMIRELLTSQGITVKPNDAKAAPAKDAADTDDTKKSKK